jgi:hypothetical protein
VLSHDGENICRKSILKFMEKGKKHTIRLNMRNGEIKCTVDHLIYTDNGWQESGNIKPGDYVLFARHITGNNTTWERVFDIDDNGEQLVYDIEVEDTHCFFANGFLVHNCHHASAKTCQDVMAASPNAFWRYGCSATPYREDGAEIVLQSLFGRKIVDISSSYLINNGFLAIPHIIFDPIEDNCKLNSYQQIYKECVSGNDEFNTRVVNIAEYLIEKGLSVLFINFGEKEQDYCMPLVKELRKNNIDCELYPKAAKMQKQLKYANDIRAQYVALVGEKEMEEGLIQFKNMTTGEQEEMSLEEIIMQLNG